MITMKKLVDKNKLKDLFFDGMTIAVGGFMAVGTPETIIDIIKEQGIKDITIVCNDAGFVDRGVGKLIVNGQVSHLIASHIGLNPEAGRLMSEQKMKVTLVPQGTLVEQIRAGGAGLGGVLTPTGIGTIVEEGKQVVRIDGKEFLLELPIKTDFALVYGSSVDEHGNVIYTKTTRNFNPIMATAAETVIVEARNIEPIDPDYVMTPHIFVDYVIKEDAHG